MGSPATREPAEAALEVQGFVPAAPGRRDYGLRVLVRVVRIALECLVAGCVYLRERVRLRGAGREGRERAAGRALRRFCTDLGATFIKIGQIVSSRADLLPHPLLEELATLQDQVPPFPFAAARRTIESELGRSLEELYERFDTRPVAAGSVAQVHRAVLRATGDDVAVKVLRPDVAERIALDRSIMLFAARLLERVSLSLRLFSLEGITREFCQAVEGQLDFVREAASCERVRANFAEDAGLVSPCTFPAACSRSVLTMEWLDGLKEEELAGTAVDLRALVRTLIRIVCRSVFVHGFMHADPHQGNLRFRPPGRLVAYDFGLMAELTESDRVEFARLVFAIATGDGKAVAKIFYDQAPRHEVESYAAYEADVCPVIEDLRGRTASQIAWVNVVRQMFDIARRHHVQVRSHLTTVYLTMVSLEGRSKQLAPDLVLFEETLPYLAEALGLVPAAPTSKGVASGAADQSAPKAESFGAGRYRVLRLLGEGARKRVYLAHDTTLDREVALGVLKTESLDPVSIRRFQLEARTMARLGDHPSIVTFYDSGAEDGRPYIVSEYMPGGTLAERLEQHAGRPLSIAEALRMAGQICQALTHAHGHGVVHRDVKPSNIWLTADGAAKLGDFGLSTASDLSSVSEAPALIGTVGYMPPEQGLGKPAEPRSDLYSLGCVVYEMLAGDPPFVGSDAAVLISRHLEAAPPPLSARNSAVSAELEQIVLHCLGKHPAERPESAAAVAEVLAQIATAGPEATPASPLERLESGVFVGRDQEMQQLQSGLDEVFAGRGRLFLLAGEPGIGKTRIAEQLAVHARRRGARVLVGRCDENEGAPVFGPWVQLLRAYVESREPAALEAEMGSTALEVAQLVPEVRDRLPHIPMAVPQEGAAARFRLFDAVTRLLKNAAAAKPLVLVLDDLHWADEASLLLLQFLAREMDQSRLLVLVTYRDVEVQYGHPLAEVLPALRRSHTHERMRLRGLAESDVRALLGALGGHEMPSDLARAIHLETEGNPFFVKEIMSHLVEEGRLRWDSGRWVADRRPEEIGLPESVREVIERRTARLSGRCRQVLTLASVIGREFDAAVLERVADLGHEALVEALAEAAAALVVTETPRAVGRFRFGHALIRETLYGELQTAERVDLHRRIGETLEQVHGDRLEHHLSEIAHHFAEAAPGVDVEKAVSYALRAAAAAHTQLAFEEAARCYTQALKTLDLRRPADELQRCQLLVKLGEARLNAGQFDRSKETFLRAADLAEALGAADELALAALGYGGSTYVVFEITQPGDRVVVLLEKALARLDDRDSALRAQVMARLAVALNEPSDGERRQSLAREALAMAQKVGDPAALGRVSVAAIWAGWGPDNLEERLRLTADLAVLARDTPDPAVGAFIDGWRALTLAEAGDTAGAFRVMDVAAQRPVVGRGYLRWLLISVGVARAHFDGRFEDAVRLIGDARLLGEEMQSRDAIFFTTVQTLFLRWHQGLLDDEFAKWISIGREMRNFPLSRIMIALGLAEAGSAEAQRELDLLAQADFADIPRDVFWFSSIWMLIETTWMLRDVDRARVLYELLAPYAGRGMGTFLTWFGTSTRSLGLLATLLGRFDDAARYFEDGLEVMTRTQGRPWVALIQHEYAGMLVSRGRPGDREKARVLVAQAIDAARTIGMRKLLTDALALKLRLEGVAAENAGGSIEILVSSLDTRRPDLRPHAAPDGTVTLIFSDIEGFGAMIERLGDRRAHEIVSTHNAIIREQMNLQGGFEVGSQSDGFLLAFSSAARGLACAVGIQQAFASYSEGHPEQPIRVRIGMHTGEVIKDGDMFFGKTVIRAARIAAQARGREILVSSLVRQLTESLNEVQFGRVRELELEGLAGRHSVSPVAWGEEPEEPAAHDEPVAASASAPYVFQKVGDFWTIAYEGKSFMMRDGKGLHYIARLLRHPGQEVHVLDLVGNGSSATTSRGRESPTVHLGHAGEVLDPQAKAAYKARLDDLRSELEEAREHNDVERATGLQEEIDAIAHQLSAAYGLGGRTRKSADAAERARKAVQRRIADSIARIKKEHSALGLHLGNNIRLGAFCVYHAERVVDWRL